MLLLLRERRRVLRLWRRESRGVVGGGFVFLHGRFGRGITVFGVCGASKGLGVAWRVALNGCLDGT